MRYNRSVFLRFPPGVVKNVSLESFGREAGRDIRTGSSKKIYSADWYTVVERRGSPKTSETVQKESLVAAARRGEITSKSPENLSEHFLNSAFARLAYYFYGSPDRRNRKREQGSSVGDNAARSISNMLINDLFERWIGGVEHYVSFFVRATSIWMSEGMLSEVARISRFPVLAIGKNHKRLRSPQSEYSAGIENILRNSSNDGFVRVDRISNSTASPLGITSFARRRERTLRGTFEFSCKRMNFILSSKGCESGQVVNAAARTQRI